LAAIPTLGALKNRRVLHVFKARAACPRHA
jgi:hypothetical protein